MFSQTRPVATGGSYTFTLPVVDGYGLESFLYLDPEVATGYEYSAEGSRFSKFILPDPFPNGATEFQLVVNDQFFTLFAGQEFDFRNVDLNGVDRFKLLGIPVTEGIDPNMQPPFVSGLSFTDAGVVTVNQRALTPGVQTPVPEPSSVVLLGISICMLGLRAGRRRLHLTGIANSPAQPE
ncbi:PEP-CTERM motif protein [Alienimonas californiensis]|uniref:PEP-CTERM motif protein n=1 Tax=Alienimonas californiensis TaxID=2527989 RepID=A0A517P6K2_9PLAN|nr:PEP-CTERM motif protein [Alienimonas californiensis]